MSILITGHNGLLAPYIIKNLSAKYKIYTCSRNFGDFKVDLIKEDLVKKIFKNFNPQVIIHCAAFTNVDMAEIDSKTAYLVNRDATINILKNISQNTHFIYFSTDQVYPNKPGNHKEGEENPVNVYGLSKLEGAKNALNLHNNTTVLHTNMFGRSLSKTRKSFSDIIIEHLSKQTKLYLYSDAYFSPLHLETISAVVLKIIERKIYGTYNLGSREGMSKEMFILKLAKHLNLSTANTEPIKSENLDNRAKRALDLRLNVNKIETSLGLELPKLVEEIKKL